MIDENQKDSLGRAFDDTKFRQKKDSLGRWIPLRSGRKKNQGESIPQTAPLTPETPAPPVSPASAPDLSDIAQAAQPPPEPPVIDGKAELVDDETDADFVAETAVDVAVVGAGVATGEPDEAEKAMPPARRRQAVKIVSRCADQWGVKLVGGFALAGLAVSFAVALLRQPKINAKARALWKRLTAKKPPEAAAVAPAQPAAADPGHINFV